MKIAVDARPLAGPPNGFTSYLASIMDVLLKHSHEIILVSDKPLPKSELVDRCQQVVLPSHGKIGRNIWAQTQLRRHLAHSRYDIYFSGSDVGLPFFYFGKTELLLGLLDVIPLRFPTIYLARRPDITIPKYVIPQFASMWKARRIITISDTSRRDIKRFCPWKRVTRVYIKLDTANIVKDQTKKERQFVYVGNVDPRKKIDTAIRALAIFNSTSKTPYNLKLIGGGYKVYDDLIKELGLGDRVIATGYLTERQKMETIANSVAMVYPSLYEGYGLAITEAYLNDVPVICGLGGSQSEIGGDGALYIDPNDPNDVAKAMQKVLDSKVQTRLKAGREAQLKMLLDPTIDQQTIEFFEASK